MKRLLLWQFNLPVFMLMALMGVAGIQLCCCST
jgi:hypothetical protein